MIKLKTRILIFLSISLLLFISQNNYSVEIPETIKVRIQIDNTTARINDRIASLDAPSKIINNRTYVPIRFISEAFGAKVDWDSSLRMVTITLDNPEFYLNKSIKREDEIKIWRQPYASNL